MIFGLAAWCSDSKHLEGVLVSGSDLARKSKLFALKLLPIDTRDARRLHLLNGLCSDLLKVVALLLLALVAVVLHVTMVSSPLLPPLLARVHLLLHILFVLDSGSRLAIGHVVKLPLRGIGGLLLVRGLPPVHI